VKQDEESLSDMVGLPEAVMLIETPTSLANDSQLRQLLNNMQN